MRRKTNTRLAMWIMLTIEIVTTVLIYQKNLIGFVFSDIFFTWGLIDLLLSLTLIFGFENRMINSAYTKSGNETYIQNVSNFIGANSKNFFKSDNDMSAGGLLFILGIINLVIYIVIMILN